MAKEARSVEADYEAKLEEAERLIRRLRRENEEQRKDVRQLICLICNSLVVDNLVWHFISNNYLLLSTVSSKIITDLHISSRKVVK